jgi:hypothetical protein
LTPLGVGIPASQAIEANRLSVARKIGPFGAIFALYHPGLVAECPRLAQKTFFEPIEAGIFPCITQLAGCFAFYILKLPSQAVGTGERAVA